jgi:hypothetical protein
VLHTCGVDLPGYIKYLAALAIPLTAILVFVKEARKFVADSYAWVWRRLAPKQSKNSVELRVVPDNQRSHWSEGSMGRKPHMQVVCRLNITNVGPAPAFQILDAFIKKPRTPLLAPMDVRQVYRGRLAHPLQFYFGVQPPVCKSGQDFVADIILIDQFAKKHVVRRMVFKALGGAGWVALEKQWEQEKKLRETQQSPD